MYRNLRTLALTLLLFAGLALTSTTNAQADNPASGPAGVLACLDNTKNYSKPAGTPYFPEPKTYLTATTFCNDIQIRPIGADRAVKVCFKPSSGAAYCQPNYKKAAANLWTVIATGVQDKTKFYFRFQTTAVAKGNWAA